MLNPARRTSMVIFRVSSKLSPTRGLSEKANSGRSSGSRNLALMASIVCVVTECLHGLRSHFIGNLDRVNEHIRPAAPRGLAGKHVTGEQVHEQLQASAADREQLGRQ